MILATYGATAITRVAVGRTRKLRWSQGRDPGGIVLIEGRTLGNTVVANKITRVIATTNSGTAASTSSRFELSVSKTFSRLNAAHEPMATESGIDITAATATKTAEFTSLGASSLVTGSCAASEIPRLPCSRPEIQVRYCWMTG